MDTLKLIDIDVNFFWDDEAHVWVATSDTLPGLVLESDSFDVLEKKVADAVPELLELNGLPKQAIIDIHTNKKEAVFA